MTRQLAACLGAVLVLGIVVRALVLPFPGLANDMDAYASWIHGIAVDGWAHAYDNDVGYPPVLVWIWGVLAAIAPEFQTVSVASDPGLRVLMKAPAALADVGIAVSVAWWFRDRPKVAVASFAAALLCPVIWYVSSWWGQVDSVFVLPALLAVHAVRRDKPALAAMLLTLSLMAKPQAAVFIVPFGAWMLATQRLPAIARSAAAALGTAIVLWVPFLEADGPARFVRGLLGAQDGVFAVLSIQAFNPWWYVQQLAGGTGVSDGSAVIGPVTYRLIGVAAMAVVSAIVGVGVYRRPSPGQFAMGLTAITLGAFVTLTTMHERYAYPAVVFLLLAWPRREFVWTWFALAACVSLNVIVTTVPPPGMPGGVLVAVVVSVVITAVAIACLRWVWSGGAGEAVSGRAVPVA